MLFIMVLVDDLCHVHYDNGSIELISLDDAIIYITLLKFSDFLFHLFAAKM